MIKNLRGVFGDKIDEPLCLDHSRVLDTDECGKRYCKYCLEEDLSNVMAEDDHE